MTTILEVVVAPMCNFCNTNPALYDCPTIMGGSWAYVCKECAESKTTPSRINMGSQFKIREIKKNLKAETLKLGIEPDETNLKYWEKVMDDGIRTVKCPYCKMARRLESDADGVFICESCKQRVKIPISFF